MFILTLESKIILFISQVIILGRMCLDVVGPHVDQVPYGRLPIDVMLQCLYLNIYLNAIIIINLKILNIDSHINYIIEV